MRRFVVLLAVFAAALTSCASPVADWTSDERLGVVADLGFRPDQDGFSFVNFTQGPNGLTLTNEDVRKVLGSQACREPGDEQTDCALDPEAAAFKSDNIRLSHGGVCEGISILGLLFYTGRKDPTEFASEEPYGMTLPGNSALENEILLWHATQLTTEVNESLDRGSPTYVLDKLASAWEDGSENYTLGIYNLVDGRYQNGHASIPYKIEHIGDGQVLLYIYNSNLPGQEEAIEIDTKTNTWSYRGQYIMYDGSADLELAPLSTRLNIPLEAQPLSGARGSADGTHLHCFAS